MPPIVRVFVLVVVVVVSMFTGYFKGSTEEWVADLGSGARLPRICSNPSFTIHKICGLRHDI